MVDEWTNAGARMAKNAHHNTKQKNTMNVLLQQIANTASADLRKLIEEGAEDIQAAIHKAAEESQLQDTAPKFSLGFKIAVDLDKNAFECALSWSVKQVLSIDHAIEDPSQGKLVIDDTIVYGGKSVETTDGAIKKVASALRKN